MQIKYGMKQCEYLHEIFYGRDMIYNEVKQCFDSQENLH